LILKKKPGKALYSPPDVALGCPGYLEKDILIYVLETGELYIFGACGECNVTGSLTVSFRELLMHCSVTTAVM